jgi:hypothetical protein
MEENLEGMGHDLYETFDRTICEVRLVILSAGPITAPIEFRLTVVSLQDNPRYEALSYCWGDDSDLESIKLQAIQGRRKSVQGFYPTQTRAGGPSVLGKRHIHQPERPSRTRSAGGIDGRTLFENHKLQHIARRIL